MKREEGLHYWAAIRVWRGFPVEAKAFRKKDHANRQERIWRRAINLDYDETGVLPLSMERNFSK